MSRIFIRSLLALLAAIVVAGASGYWLLHMSLPQLDGQLTVNGLTAAASIERDNLGIVTIAAADRADLSFATGFVHAQDRFFQMDLSRRRAAGELAVVFGEAAVDADKRTRLHRLRERARHVIELSSAEDRVILEAYAAGVNAGLESLGARPFEYLLLRSRPEAWRSEDSILVGYAMFLTLNDELAIRDLRRGYARRALPKEVFDWIYPKGSEWDAPIGGDVEAARAIPNPELLDLRAFRVADARSYRDFADERVRGSNNWAVSGRLTKSGHAIVANDMHLDLTTPNVFYRARYLVDGEEQRDVTGLTLPGTPVMVAGSNGNVAWAFTNSNGDWSDSVLVRRGPDADSYLTPQGPRAIREHTETIVVKGGDSRELVVRETVWGPIVDDLFWPDAEIAARWTAHDPEAINLVQLQLETAADVTAALNVANRMGIPPQNFVAGDAEGNIGWTIAGRIPRRSGYDAGLPADWSLGGGWDGYHEPADYPRVVNPAAGRIWTANARVVDGEALRIIGDGGYALGARAAQIRDALFDGESFEPADMLAIQTDDRAVFLERWRQLLLATLENAGEDSQRAQFQRLVRDWVPRASVDSVGYRLVREYRSEVRQRVFEMLMAPVRNQYPDNDLRLTVSNQFEAPLWQLLTVRPAHLLTADYSSWDDLLIEAADHNIRRYHDHYDSPLAERSWGERNTAAIRHPLSYALPLLSPWLDMPTDPLAGDRDMPRAQGPDFGASERFGVSPGDEATGYLHMPAGQSGHPQSDYYRRGHDDWLEARPSPFLPGAARHRLSLIPAD